MYTPNQLLRVAAAEYEAREQEPTPLWQLAKCANVPLDVLRYDVLPERGITVRYDERDKPFVTKADVRKLMNLDIPE